ncbi:oxidoreductase [Deferribacter autotrophicus]|uniref:Oxidoreductase n=1 Tax=Deferribacter autotrophicus TaxID=500465 RepID=A0A5A8F759_9BACT|nr:molybdopterin-dependent oxidoreductase [Deferribacter autotrophicus]KAA0257875.1 oxidoreductase [Deferribacter autotrophicus]
MSFLKDIGTPVFNAERLKEIPSKNEYLIEISYGEKKEKIFYNDLYNIFEKKVVNCRLTSVSRWSVRANWEGILWSDFVNYLEVSDYKYVYFESYGGYITTVFGEDMNNPRILIATHVDGEEIEFEYGGPVRMIIPNLWGYKSCKWLKKIYFIDEYIVGYWEGYGYDDRGLIEPTILLDINSKEHKRIKGGEVLEF